MYSIRFLLQGDAISSALNVQIPGDRYIADLKGLIKDQAMSALGYGNASDFDTYKATIPNKDYGSLQEFYRELDRGERENQKLSVITKIADAFPNPGNEDSLVIVKLRQASSRTYRGGLPAAKEPARELGASNNSKRKIAEGHLELDLFRRVTSSPWSLEDYCDPRKLLNLPFLFLGPRPIGCFKFDRQGHFLYYGRQRFRQLYDIAIQMRVDGRCLYFLHGSLGVGKSHLLAALACALTKAGKRVVYLPDCWEMLKCPFMYLRSALQLAFADLRDWREYLDNDARTLDDLTVFCQNVAPMFCLFFIVDQEDALDMQANQYDDKRKWEVRSLLDCVSSGHLKLASSSSDYKGGTKYAGRQTHEGKVTMYEGLSEAEMQQWWAIHEGLRELPMVFNEEQKQTLQDLTGRMPLLLSALTKIRLDDVEHEPDTPNSGSRGGNALAEICSDDGEHEPQTAGNAGKGSSSRRNKFAKLVEKLWTSPVVELAERQISRFIYDRCSKSRETPDTVTYQESMLDCLSNGPTAVLAGDYLDWRYFFVDDDRVGHATSEIVRQIAVRYLRPQVSIDRFLTYSWYKSISCAPNRTALGFTVESMMISWIATNGCMYLMDPTRCKFFSTEQPELEVYEGTAIYIRVPLKFNPRAVDAILVHVNRPPFQEAIVVGIQIAITKNYGQSAESAFMREWETYRRQLRLGDRVTYDFLLIHGELDDSESVYEEVAAVERELDSGGSEIAIPAYRRFRSTVKAESHFIGEKLREFASMWE